MFLCMFLLLAAVQFSGCSRSTSECLKVKDWEIIYNSRSGGVDIYKNSLPLCGSVYSSFKYQEKLIKSCDYPNHRISSRKYEDEFGKGYIYQVVCTDSVLPMLVQTFYIYPDYDYVLTDFTIEDDQELSSNYMAPLIIDSLANGSFLWNADSRVLKVPFDNDKWGRYRSVPLPFEQLTSYEVTALFNNEERNGIIVGSVEHDTWKTAVSIGKSSLYNMGSLCCYGGVADEQTRDSKPHGSLVGRRLKSPKVFIGYFSDWRDGLEAYANANATITPPRKWEGAVPFGWNSWGVLKFDLTYQKAVEVSEYIKDHLQNRSFVSPAGTVYVGLDSGWNSFTEQQLASFVKICKDNGQKAGVYWTPFTDWGRNPEKVFEDCPEYKYKDVYLYANGAPQELDGAYALDPTHPGRGCHEKQIGFVPPGRI